MKRLILTLLVALAAVHASAQVITTLKSYRYNVTPAPPAYLVRGEDGTLYGVNGNMLYRWQPDGSGFSVLNQAGFIGPLSLSGSTLYGMASFFEVFKINTDGSGYTVFEEEILGGNLLRQLQISYTAYERPGVSLAGNTLYGWGFKINTDGTGYTELAGFPPWDGFQDWYLEFEVSGDNYFGSTSRDGQYGAGTVFRLNTDGTGYTVLVNITPKDALGIGGPRLTVVGNTLYGYGFPDRMFKVNTDGTGYSVLTNANFPRWNKGLQHSDGAFYWATTSLTNNRTSWAVCKMNTDGTGYTVLRGFTESTNPPPPIPSGTGVDILTVAGGHIYGVGPSNLEGIDGLSERGGILFKMNTDGSGFAVLHEFSEPNLYPDGRNPDSLTVSEGVLYGFDFGPDLNRRLFKMSTDGTGFTTLKGYDLDDRFDPVVRPTVSGSTLFGVGGSRGILQQEPYNDSRGLVYRMNTDGSGYTVLKEFTLLADGARSPAAALALSGSVLFGTIGSGRGGSDGGKIFTLNTNGTGYTFLRILGPSTVDTSSARWTNSEGVLWGDAELTISNNTLYGAASEGGLFGCGTVFKMDTDGTGFSVLKHFTPEAPQPRERLTLSGDTLYGISSPEYEALGGAVFRVNTDGTHFQVLKQFPDAAWDNVSNRYTNSEGVNPILGLALQGNTLYGTTSRGGQFGDGTLFKVNTDGTGFAVLGHIKDRFGNSGLEGNGLRGLVVSGSTLYGSAPWGGDYGEGGIYSISLTPKLSIERTGAYSLAVTWPSVWTEYVLQQSTNGLSSANWGNVTAAIQNDGTNKTLIVNPTGASRFYRLVHP